MVLPFSWPIGHCKVFVLFLLYFIINWAIINNYIFIKILHLSLFNSIMSLYLYKNTHRDTHTFLIKVISMTFSVFYLISKMDSKTAAIHKCNVYSDFSNERNNFSIWINMQLYNNFFFLNIILLIYSDSTLIQIGWTFEFTFLNGNFSDLWRQIKKMKKKKQISSSTVKQNFLH